MKITLELDSDINRYISLLQIEEVDRGNPKPSKAVLINQLAKKGIEAMEKEKAKSSK